MRESKIEAHLVKRVEAAGGLCPKFKNPSQNGAPDRMVLLPGGRMFFVELKAPGKPAEEHQVRYHNRLRDRGYTVLVIDTLEGVEGLGL